MDASEAPADPVSPLSISRLGKEIFIVGKADALKHKSTELTAKMPCPVEPLMLQFQHRTSR